MACFRLLSQGRGFAALFGGTRRQRQALSKLLPTTRGPIDWWEKPPKGRNSMICYVHELPRLEYVADVLEELAGCKVVVVPGRGLDISIEGRVPRG